MHNTCNMKYRSSTFEAVPFTIGIAADVLDDMRDRITRARIPEAVHGIGWTEGMDVDALRAVLAHWRDFDWPSAEAAINRVPAFRAEVDGYDIHFVHVQGTGSARVPLILTNGWPSCFTELLPLVPLLTKEVDGLSFDVVIPSLPGYGFSARPMSGERTSLELQISGRDSWSGSATIASWPTAVTWEVALRNGSGQTMPTG